MGLFNKRIKKEGEKEIIPKLPELPKLPGLSNIQEETPTKSIYQLPKFPNNSLGEKFSQNTIKEAVAGEEEGEEVEVDDFVEDMQMMPEPQIKESSEEFGSAARGMKKFEPVFIRLDKFEESLHLFEKAKNQISEIENMLGDIKKTKEEEERELDFWEKEIQNIKSQIEKVDRDIFSKVG